MDKMKFTKERGIKTMTTEGHYRGLDESCNRRKKKCIKKESQEECNKDLLEL